MRKIADCRRFPSVSGCNLTIAGPEEEVVRAAAEHAVSVHGHEDGPDLREQIRATLADEGAPGRYGTVMIASLVGSADRLVQAAQDWVEQRDVEGFLLEEVMLAADGRTVVAPVFFDSREAYERLADDPEQDGWWQERMAPLLTDVTWIDGTWQQTLAATRRAAVGQSEDRRPVRVSS